MFRSLATRLVALYVLVAIALVVIAGGAVTAFALSTFVIGEREAQAYVAREAPDLVRSYALRHLSLGEAAPEIVRRLSRPGLRVAVIEDVSGGHHIVALDDPMRDRPGDNIMVFPLPHRNFAAAAAPPSGGTDKEMLDHPPPPPMLGFEHGAPLPWGLSMFFHIRPRHIAVPGGMIAVFVDPRPLARTIGAFWSAMIPIGILSILLAWLLGRYITNQALRPLVETTAALRQFASGDFTPRAIVSAERNEIGELVTAYNGAVQQVTRAFEERRLADLQIRQFIADAGHELRTPLTVIMGFIDVLRRRSTDLGGSGRIFDTMSAESRRMRTLIEKLIVLARLDTPEARQPEDVSVDELVSGVVEALAALDPAGRLVLRVDSDAVVRCDEAELHEAISNIVENALRYAPRSTIEIVVSADDSSAHVSVTDHGEGMSAEETAHVFDRFYRGHQRGESEGFGLGLAIAKRAVERAGGEIAVESEPARGTRFTIRLPRLSQPTRSVRSA
ncbi:MAG: HAMP domain-containing histidine kinase [Candidatus Eremiobacteraeota bacterium]|nr:HAMP domain-containing histidine kinase [Candidatus Eremiobacteraeota bacterium]